MTVVKNVNPTTSRKYINQYTHAAGWFDAPLNLADILEGSATVVFGDVAVARIAAASGWLRESAESCPPY
jgi:hypothetical protein